MVVSANKVKNGHVLHDVWPCSCKYGEDDDGQVCQEPRYYFLEVLPGVNLITMIFEENILCSPTALSVSSSKWGKFHATLKVLVWKCSGCSRCVGSAQPGSV